MAMKATERIIRNYHFGDTLKEVITNMYKAYLDNTFPGDAKIGEYMFRVLGDRVNNYKEEVPVEPDKVRQRWEDVTGQIEGIMNGIMQLSGRIDVLEGDIRSDSAAKEDVAPSPPPAPGIKRKRN